ncbi:MAG: phosphoglycerate dehydrogenase [Chloroflexi bacterium]|nr:phosphoglycerate dehydrogenase [Chloroflexota bacterium]
MTFRVLVTDPIAQEGIDILKGGAEVDVRLGLPKDKLIASLGDYDALVVRSETKVTAEVIEAGQRLQVIGRAGVGVDNIDVEAASRRGIIVVNAPEGNTISAAEHALALLLAVARHIPQAYQQLQKGIWRRQEHMGVEVRGKVLGIVGLGRVGSEVAKRARGMEMKLLVYDPYVSAEQASRLGAEVVSLEDLVRRSDFITIHTTLTSTTHGLIGARELSLAKPTAYIINAARGGIVDEAALRQAVDQGRLAGAAVDVFTQEPATENPLFGSDKIIVTPHLGASTAEAQTNVAVDTAEQVLAVLRGQPVRYAVNAPLVAPEAYAQLFPYIAAAANLGRLLNQLLEGQLEAVTILYEGEIANHDSRPLKAALLSGLLEAVTDERVNVVNVDHVVAHRGLKITEQHNLTCENYSSLLTAEVKASRGKSLAAATLMRGETHIVRLNDYWMDVVPTGGYFLFIDHRDRPGLIGSVGNILGQADINISSMQVGRLQPRGRALMVLGLDGPIREEHRKQLLAIPDVYAVRLVKL